MGVPTSPRRLLLCATPEDADLRVRLDAHLALLERNGLVTTWHDGLVAPGQDRAAQILAELLRADLILLLISASFLESDEHYELLMKRALARHERREALVIPILVRPVDWEGAPFAALSCLPANHLPVTMWRDVDDALRNVVQGVHWALDARANGHPFTAEPEPPREPAPTQERALDAAIPAAVTVGELTEVLTMVTTTASGGLRALIQLSPQAFSASPGDVKRTLFELDFPVDAQGRPRPATVTVALESKDFDPPMISKKLLVPPRADSTVCTLLVKPKHTGSLSLQLELRREDVTIWSQRLLTTGAPPGSPVEPGYLLTSVPLSTMGHAVLKSTLIGAVASEAAAEKPQSTMFSLQELVNLEQDRIANEDRRRDEARRHDAEPKMRPPSGGGWGPPPGGGSTTSPSAYGRPAPPSGPAVTPPSGDPGEPPVMVPPKWPDEITQTKIIIEQGHQLVTPNAPASSSRLLWVAAALITLLLAGAALLYFATH